MTLIPLMLILSIIHAKRFRIMENEYTPEHEAAYLKGFNNGYVLEKYEPVLAKELVKGISNTALPYTDGLKAGSKEFQKEKFKAQVKQARDADQGQENEGGIER